MQRTKLQKAEDGLRKLWGNDEHYGIPEKYRTSELTLHRAQEYRTICELVSRSPLQLRQLWTLELCSIPTAYQKLKAPNFSKALQLARQAILADWKKTNFGTYEMEAKDHGLKRPASNWNRGRPLTVADSRGKKRRGSQTYELSDDENIIAMSEGESDGASVQQDGSDPSAIDPDEPIADRVSWPAESSVKSARAEEVEDVVIIADARDAEDVHGLSPELGDQATASRKEKTPLQLIHEVMAVNSHRFKDEADQLVQTAEQLELLRDRHAKLKVKLQSTDKEINQLNKEREKLQANSKVNNVLLKNLEQVAEFLQSAAQATESNENS